MLAKMSLTVEIAFRKGFFDMSLSMDSSGIEAETDGGVDPRASSVAQTLVITWETIGEGRALG